MFGFGTRYECGSSKIKVSEPYWLLDVETRHTCLCQACRQKTKQTGIFSYKCAVDYPTDWAILSVSIKPS